MLLSHFYHIPKFLKNVLAQRPKFNTEESVLNFELSAIAEFNGGAKRDRTADLLRARQALSQLSYGPF